MSAVTYYPTVWNALNVSVIANAALYFKSRKISRVSVHCVHSCTQIPLCLTLKRILSLGRWRSGYEITPSLSPFAIGKALGTKNTIIFFDLKC